MSVLDPCPSISLGEERHGGRDTSISLGSWDTVPSLSHSTLIYCNFLRFKSYSFVVCGTQQTVERIFYFLDFLFSVLLWVVFSSTVLSLCFHDATMYYCAGFICIHYFVSFELFCTGFPWAILFGSTVLLYAVGYHRICCSSTTAQPNPCLLTCQTNDYDT